MVTTRSKDGKRTALPDSADAGAGSKREVPPESNKSPPPKHQKQADKKEEVEPVKYASLSRFYPRTVSWTPNG